MNQKEQQFVKVVWEYYRQKGRKLPWRTTSNPYRIHVSEVMLQQTQVDRVLPKYQSFLKKFPSVAALARAPLGDVLRAWQGLGYNRRARMLHQCARTLLFEYGGKYPKTYEALGKLPGIGPYTAGAIMAFAYNKPVPIIETNIRTVFIHHFFNTKTEVTDAEILSLVERTLDQKQPREWYSALMDYGSYLKKEHGNQNSRSKHYTRQSTFAGSGRQIRGAILRYLASKEKASRKSMLDALSQFEDVRVDAQKEALLKEHLIEKVGRSYRLPR